MQQINLLTNQQYILLPYQYPIQSIPIQQSDQKCNVVVIHNPNSIVCPPNGFSTPINHHINNTNIIINNINQSYSPHYTQNYLLQNNTINPISNQFNPTQFTTIDNSNSNRPPKISNAFKPQHTGITSTTPRNTSQNTTMANYSHTSPSIPLKSTAQEEFKCDICDKGFKRKANLNAHVKVHTEYAYICPYCNKKFARNGNLKQHIRIHTNERPFKCNFCVKAFRQKHSLHDHLRTHTGEKPFGCKFCSTKFAARCNLIVHERTHTGCTPYQCTNCNKKYASKSGLNAHLKKFH